MKTTIEYYLAPVAQLDRASVFGTEGWGFEPLQAYLRNNLKVSHLRLAFLLF